MSTSRSRKRYVVLLLVGCVRFAQVSSLQLQFQNYQTACDDEATQKNAKNNPLPCRRHTPLKNNNVGNSKTSTAVGSLSEQAFRIAGDTSFSRRLQELEKQQIERQGLVETASKSPSPTATYTFIVLSSLLSFHFGGRDFIFKEFFQESAKVLSISWLPVFLGSATWIEIFPLFLLSIRPPIRTFLIEVFFPDMVSTLRKLLIGEFRKQVWSTIMKLFPKRMFTPSDLHFKSSPSWLRYGLERINDAADKFVTSSFRKVFENTVNQSISDLYDSLSTSVFELTMTYEDKSGEKFTSSEAQQTPIRA